jgi:hypothetical protein
MDHSPTTDGRLTAFGNQLIEIHIWLREELETLLADVDAYLAGAAADRPRELGAHCLAFCSAVSRHHTGEDVGAFVALGQRFPQLRPVLDELSRDHDLVASSLRRLTELLDGLTDQTDVVEARRMRAELGTLAALLETHFGYEERKLVAALNTLDPDQATTESLLGIRPSTG